MQELVQRLRLLSLGDGDLARLKFEEEFLAFERVKIASRVGGVQGRARIRTRRA